MKRLETLNSLYYRLYTLELLMAFSFTGTKIGFSLTHEIDAVQLAYLTEYNKK